jgi:hypothetical protein
LTFEAPHIARGGGAEGLFEASELDLTLFLSESMRGKSTAMQSRITGSAGRRHPTHPFFMVQSPCTTLAAA